MHQTGVIKNEIHTQNNFLTTTLMNRNNTEHIKLINLMLKTAQTFNGSLVKSD